NKLADSYDRSRICDNRAALSYIASHKRAGDKVMTVRPAESAVLLGGHDFYAMALVHFDELYLSDGGIVDRWAGGRLVWKLDQYRDTFLRNERVWIVVDERRLAQMPPEVATFLTSVCKVEYEFFGGQLLLWERQAGRLLRAPQRGGET